MRKKELLVQIEELKQTNKFLNTLLNFGIKIEEPISAPNNQYNESNIKFNETINQMILDGDAINSTFNNNFYLRYFLENLYRTGYRKVVE